MSTPKLLTIEDIRNRYGCGRDAAYDIIKKCGGRMIAGRWRVREEKVDAYEMADAKPVQPTPIMVKDYAAQM